MAQSEEARAGHKRAASRNTRGDHRAEKKRKISTTNLSTPLSSSVQSPAASSPAPEKRPTKLPSRIYDSKPLPTLPEPQAPSLSNEEYQTIAASGVLQASLDRSRLRWVHDGVFERYWVKPESGKNARPPPPNNPELKWQKHKGPCRLRIEPHIFEAEVYVEEKAKPPPPPAPVKQYVPPAYHQQSPSAYGQPYRQNQQPYGQPHQQQQPYYQNRTLPPMQQPGHAHSHPPPNVLPPYGNMSQSPAPSQPSPSRGQQSPSQGQYSPSPAQQEKKASPDPVISMLASRASSDPELKALMKEVATGSATPDQLKVFQNHIDELTKLITDRKKKEEEEAAAAEVAKPTGQQADVIQYDGAGDHNLHDPMAYQQQRPYQPPYQHQPQPHPHHHQPQQHWQLPPPPPPPVPPPPTSLPVIIAFTTPGATEDRFLFPQSCILESLSPQHLLASFIVTRKAGDPVDSRTLQPAPPPLQNGDQDANTDVEANKENPTDGEDETWHPITLMVEVAYNREHIIDCVRRWVKPADEVRKEMEAVMARCKRAEDRYLPLRLPVRGSVMAEAEDLEAERAAERAAVEEGRPRGKYVKKVKKEGGKDQGKEQGKGKEGEKSEVTAESGVKDVEKVAETASATQPPAKDATSEQNGAEAVKEVSVEGTTDAAATGTENSRPRRAVRKSVRISEA